MSTNYTQNYNLCQWEASDKVLRTDFNDDNAKIDAALTAQKAAIDQSQATADAAYSPENPQVVVGYYTGNGGSSQVINLGFRPKAVLVIDRVFRATEPNVYHSAVMADGMLVANDCGVLITNSGFQVKYTTSPATIMTNAPNSQYFYLAVR